MTLNVMVVEAPWWVYATSVGRCSVCLQCCASCDRAIYSNDVMRLYTGFSMTHMCPCTVLCSNE